MIAGIVGGSGSGKSWLAKRLVQNIGAENAGVVCQDSFYKDLSHLTPEDRRAVNFDDPKALEWAAFRKCLTHLASGRAGRIPRYNFATHARDEGELLIEPHRLIIFDGLWLLHRPALRRFFSLSIFIEAEDALTLERRVARDCAERGRAEAEVREWHGARVLPMQRIFVEPQRKFADVVLGAPVTEGDVQTLTDRILNSLKL